jgi:8-oxo-dGTP pyrophosphatase MutT (NUDIX family)
VDEPTRAALRGVTFLDPEGRPMRHDGTTPVTWRVGAFALAVRDGRVLLIEPASGDRWELPGGGVDVHETLLEGATRECREETGYAFVAAAPEPVYLGELFFHWHQSAPPTPGPRYWHALMAFFVGTVTGDADRAWRPDPHEVRGVRWVDPADLTPERTQPHQWEALRRAGLV